MESNYSLDILTGWVLASTGFLQDLKGRSLESVKLNFGYCIHMFSDLNRYIQFPPETSTCHHIQKQDDIQYICASLCRDSTLL